jgi:hypothetical protein
MYLLFPLFEKGTLRDLINRHLASRTPLSEELIVQIFADTCKAVQQFHDKGLAHRDIKVTPVACCHLGTRRCHRVSVSALTACAALPTPAALLSSYAASAFTATAATVAAAAAPSASRLTVTATTVATLWRDCLQRDCPSRARLFFFFFVFFASCFFFSFFFFFPLRQPPFAARGSRRALLALPPPSPQHLPRCRSRRTSSWEKGTSPC